MATEVSFDLSRTALLAMDCQAGIVHLYANPKEAFIDRASRVVKAARAAGMPVIHVQVGFRPGMPEVNPRNRLLSAIKLNPERQKLFEGAAGAVHPALGPEPGDIIVTKHRVSAFAGTDLELILRSLNITTLVLFGIATSGVVLSTLLDATDADFNIALVSDCCADRDPELHVALINRLFPNRADVLTADEFIAWLPARSSAADS